MNRRLSLWVTALSLVVALGTTSAVTGCAKRMVSVETGQRVVCTYGEIVSSTVHTVRVPAREAGKYSVTTTRITCAKHTQLEKLYAEAQAALGKKDLTTAKAKLAEVVKIDATYKSASSQLKAIQAGNTPTADGSSGPGSSGSTGSTSTTPPGSGTTPGGTKPEGPVASLLVYTPDSIDGFKARPVVADAFSISRQYLSLSSADVSSLVIVAEQFRSSSAAQNWLKTNVRGRYTRSADNVQIGKRTAYLATDGQRFAIIAWTEGPIAVAIEADAGSGPTSAFTLLKAVANDIVH